MMPELSVLTGGATFSENGLYRYLLWRRIAPELTTLLWVMLNASSAGADKDDPTIGAVTEFTRRAGFGRLVVVNQYGYIATDPEQLRADAAAGVDIVGPENDAYIRAEAKYADATVVAWGAKGGARASTVISLLVRNGPRPVHLGLTKGGHPRHPLYVRRDTPFVPWPDMRRAS